jgi:DNA-binding LacI/PurR family transcriptional regulator
MIKRTGFPERQMRGQSAITMKDVAERAGVSMMTVSLALRGDASGSRISEETRQRVLEAARALRYRPNARGRALRSGCTNLLGLYAGYGVVNVRLPFFTEVVSGLQEGCEQFKKDLLLYGLFHGYTPEDIFTELADGRIDGLVVKMPPDDPVAERLLDSQLPVVAVADPLPGIPSVVVDDAAGSRLLARHLIERGYRRFVYVGCRMNVIPAMRRRDAFFRTLAEAGLDAEETQEIWSSTPGVYRGLLQSRLARERQPPAAIVCWNDLAALQVLADCRRQRIRVPEEIAVAGFDGCPTHNEDVWSLTTVRAPWAAAARTAVQYLNDLLEGKSLPQETVLPVELIAGHTA